MAFHGSGEVQFISMAGYLLGNLESPQSLEVELRRGACGLDMSVKEPNFISNLVCRGR